MTPSAMGMEGGEQWRGRRRRLGTDYVGGILSSTAGNADKKEQARCKCPNPPRAAALAADPKAIWVQLPSPHPAGCQHPPAQHPGARAPLGRAAGAGRKMDGAVRSPGCDWNANGADSRAQIQKMALLGR